jgi:transcriptional regulator with XRE-family HTH domain
MQQKSYCNPNNCLRKYRKDRGLRQHQVAAILGVGPNSISAWEKGIYIPDTPHLIDLAILYRRSMDALLLDYLAMRKDVVLKREELVLANKN